MKISLKRQLSTSIDPKGLIIAFSIILLWFISLIFLLNLQVDYSNPLLYLGLFVQMHLYTGLFITAHDAMHGVVTRNKSMIGLPIKSSKSPQTSHACGNRR